MIYSTQAMSTRWEIVLPPHNGKDDEFLRAAAEQVSEEIQHWDSRLSLFKPDSLVSYINKAAHAKPVQLNEPEWSFFVVAQKVWRESDGAFDITVAPLMKRLGLHQVHSSAAASEVWGMQHVALDPKARTIQFLRDGLAIDLGALAKGFALDQVRALLTEVKIEHAFIHGGTSSSLAMGTRPDGQLWRVALGTTEHDPVIELANQSLSVSKRKSRPAELANESTRSHILDPRTADFEDTSDLDVAAVVHESATLAEGWSTACLINGSSRLPLDISLFVQDHSRSWHTRRLNQLTHSLSEQT